MTIPKLSFLHDPRLKLVMGALEGAGFEALVVGGAARDGLMGSTPKDIDLATNAHPDAVASVLGQAGADMRPTGLDHGTWTAVVGGEGYEVTTYRRDVSTDGRRATVAFADTFDEDALRRDFTINALGLTKDGRRVDPTGEGLRDLDARRLRFVGDGAARCEEDSLRALRLFRFQGRMGSWPMDEQALAAAGGARLDNLSGERVWSEVKGILQSEQGDQAARAMAHTGIWQKLLPGTPLDTVRLDRTAARERAAGLEPSWSARIYALTGRERLPWPVSGAEARRLSALAKHQPYAGQADVAAAASGSAQAGSDLWALGSTPAPSEGVQAAVTRGAQAVLPLSADDLKGAGMVQGKALGGALQAARVQWLASGLHADRDTLFAAHAPRTNPSKEHDGAR